MRYILLLIFAFFGTLATAQDWEDQQLFGPSNPARTLRVISSTDTSFFAPIIAQFLAQNPQLAVEYLVTSTTALDQTFRQSPQSYDVVISSAMDLQFKLVNDGHAHKVEDISHPDWAQWRQSLFAFTTEPAAIVVNRQAFEGHPIPGTRQELIQALRARPDVFRNRLGTYDVRQSGLGYLFATQDARSTETYWRLMEVMGSMGLNLYCCSGDMINDLTTGKIVVAYNVLGSYASARKDAQDILEIVLPSDFPTTMMRTGFVSSHSRHPEFAAAFIRFLAGLQLENNGQDGFPLPPLSPARDIERQPTISLGPALMTYLDSLKKQNFLQEWENAVVQ
ncbi:substrate-binding domain-containing protein [Shimia sp.]|uniref:ABC transporter substrate-binding protein n=1 Tax=Shimia sp. TaxID=1954381 RepID=UPI003297A5B0